MPGPTLNLLTRPGPFPSPLAIEESAAPAVSVGAPRAVPLAGVRAVVPAPSPRLVPCPACGETCELIPTLRSPHILHLVDPGTSEKAPSMQRYLGTHRCPQLDARPALHPRYRPLTGRERTRLLVGRAAGSHGDGAPAGSVGTRHAVPNASEVRP